MRAHSRRPSESDVPPRERWQSFKVRAGTDDDYDAAERTGSGNDRRVAYGPRCRVRDLVDRRGVVHTNLSYTKVYFQTLPLFNVYGEVWGGNTSQRIFRKLSASRASCGANLREKLEGGSIGGTQICHVVQCQPSGRHLSNSQWFGGSLGVDLGAGRSGVVPGSCRNTNLVLR